MYSGLDDTTKRRMMQAKALTMEAKGGWWKRAPSLFNRAVYSYKCFLRPLCKRACACDWECEQFSVHTKMEDKQDGMKPHHHHHQQQHPPTQKCWCGILQPNSLKWAAHHRILHHLIKDGLRLLKIV